MTEAADRPAASRSAFRKSQRLRLKREFEAVFAQRWSSGGVAVIVYGKPNQLGWNRLGLSVGRRFGAATVRNRFKRLAREAFRLSQVKQPAGWDWIVVPRRPVEPSGKKKPTGKAPGFAKVPWTLAVIERDLLEQMRRIARSADRQARKPTP